MDEVKCHPLLRQPSGAAKPSLTGSRSIVVTNVPLSCPTHFMGLTRNSDLIHWTGYGLGGIHASRWLVVSAILSPQTLDRAVHNQLLERWHEDPNATFWMGNVHCSFCWKQDRNATTTKLKWLRAYITRAFMSGLKQRYGLPHSDGAWLFQGLLPKRRPGAIRAVDSPSHTSYQLWIDLL